MPPRPPSPLPRSFLLAALVAAAGCGAEAPTASSLASDAPGDEPAFASVGAPAHLEPQRLSTTPDETKTPGELCTPSNPDFDGYRHPEKVAHCRRNVSKARKRRIEASYGVPAQESARYEIDHRIPLGLGGSNADANLWPLYTTDARRKSDLEQELHDALARGTITQAEAVDRILSWR